MPDLPSYLAAAKPVPLDNRVPWYKGIAPAYLGVMLWFVFWQSLPGAASDAPPLGGVLAANPLHPLLYPLLGLIIAAVICHFLFYLVPGMLGMKTGLPLYVVGTSTYGARGGLFMPGFLMGLLQFGWLAVNAWAVAGILCTSFERGLAADHTVIQPGLWHGAMASVFIVLAAFVGLKGIRYVGRVSTYLNLIPVALLVLLLIKTIGGVSGFNVGKIKDVVDAKQAAAAAAAAAKEAPVKEASAKEAAAKDATSKASPPKGEAAKDTAADAIPPRVAEALNAAPWSPWKVIELLCIYVVGFFATAGAAGVDIAMSSRNKEDVHIGGVTGIVLPTVLAGGVAMLIVVGAYGGELVKPHHSYNDLIALNPVNFIGDIFGSEKWAKVAMIALAISSFPGACFSSFIAANSFKTTMPKINPFVSVGVGALVSMALAVSGWAGDVSKVFAVIGASFGPVCGAMLADYLLSGGKWSGPRTGFNPAGWISWIVGFIVGAFNMVVGMLLGSNWEWVARTLPHLKAYQDYIYMPPVMAFVVGFGLYLLLSVLGARTRRMEMPGVTT